MSSDNYSSDGGADVTSKLLSNESNGSNGSNESLGFQGAYESSESIGYGRQLTFSRALTFDFSSTMKRNFTLSFGFDVNSDEAWTKNLLDSYYNAAKSGNEGDIPIPAAFATNREFWKTFLLAAVNGVFIGLVALGFLNFADRVRILISYIIIPFRCSFFLNQA